MEQCLVPAALLLSPAVWPKAEERLEPLLLTLALDPVLAALARAVLLVLMVVEPEQLPAVLVAL